MFINSPKVYWIVTVNTYRNMKNEAMTHWPSVVLTLSFVSKW